MRLVLLVLGAMVAAAAGFVWRTRHGAEVWHSLEADVTEGP
ncbi:MULTISPECIES: hypothetical protein [unclassified Mycolicibacterium]|nr:MULTISPECIES: hypothetical protein [unclassified Mycolicibacterium]